MARQRQLKPFDPKPFKPGASIEWTHVYPNGSELQRSGTVWSEASKLAGYSKVCWVIPSEPLSTDAYLALAVGVVSRDFVNLHAGIAWVSEHASLVRRKGEIVSADHVGSPLGNLAYAAGNHALAQRSARDYELIA